MKLLSWSVSVPSIISHLARAKKNILAVGKRHSWIINASTGHRYHFIGTRSVAGMTTRGQDIVEIDRLRNLVLRYASIGANIDVYWLHQDNG